MKRKKHPKGSKTSEFIKKFDILNFNKNQIKLLDDCYHAIRMADKSKINNVVNNYFKDDTWLEEECTPNYPTIKVRITGICHTLFINDKSCLPDDFDP